MKQRNIRKRRALDQQEELSDGEDQAGEEQPRLTAEDLKLLQKQRQRRTVRVHTRPSRSHSPTVSAPCWKTRIPGLWVAGRRCRHADDSCREGRREEGRQGPSRRGRRW